MMRGEREQECLDIVRTFLQYEHCYGFTAEDIENFKVYLENSKPNEQPSKFPDFTFSGGFIEHFQISSSEETRKGQNFQRDIDILSKKVLQLESEKQSVYTGNQTFSYLTEQDIVNHSYYFLEESFKKHWEKHIDSYDRYKGEKERGVFLIEYPDLALSMSENLDDIITIGISAGDLLRQEKCPTYRLSRDKKLLQYVYEFREKIKYVIFVADEPVSRDFSAIGAERKPNNNLAIFKQDIMKRVEFIRVDNIPAITKLRSQSYHIDSFGIMKRSCITYVTSVGGDKNE